MAKIDGIMCDNTWIHIPFTFKLFKHGSRKVPLPTYENLAEGENKNTWQTYCI